MLKGQARLDRGVTLALLAAVLFGASTPVAKGLVQGASPQLLAGLLYLGSGAGLLIVFLARRGQGARDAGLGRRDLPWLAGAILAGGIVGPLLLMIGITRTPASSASLLLNLEGALTALLAWFIFHENFDRRIALGMAAILAGGAVISWQGRAELGSVVGPLAIAGACLAWALDNNLTQKVSASDPVQIAMLKGLIAGATNLAIAIALGAARPSAAVVAGAAVLGFLSYGVSLVLFVLALRRLGTARTGAYFSIAPFVGALVSLVLWRDPLTLGLMIGGALMAAGVWLHVSERHAHEHAHEAMDHAHPHVHDEHHQHAHAASDPPVTDPSPHTHPHHHEPMVHTHAHYPDIHHRHSHNG
ncbi:MAG: DMT family transporter [Gemmatimonadota bacterium]|nr:DMT family transporter [Gemmatimonadota bacterium]